MIMWLRNSIKACVSCFVQHVKHGRGVQPEQATNNRMLCGMSYSCLHESVVVHNDLSILHIDLK